MTGIKLVNNEYICDAYKICTYIRSYYFDKNLATESGDTIYAMGFVYLEIYPNENSKPEVYELNIPISLGFKYSEVSKAIKSFNPDEEPEEFAVYTVYNEDIFINSSMHVASTDELNKFVNFLINGKLPQDIKYSTLPSLVNECMEFNKASLGIPDFISEMTMSELARDKHDLNTPYRFIAGKTGNENGYATIKIGDIPKATSVFSAIAFEDINSALASSITISKLGKKNKIPPTEEMLYY